MENVYYTALYKVAKRLDFLLDFCIVKNREKNLVVWSRLDANKCGALSAPLRIGLRNRQLLSQADNGTFTRSLPDLRSKISGWSWKISQD